jgi:7,8-dihydropterin-6-yl-methyl-4-(beta-D-ribofuranosyl)aminobenzene 5'-phosphate synthase
MLQEARLSIVVENSASLNSNSVWAQHGLSIFLELDFSPERMRLLWDTGASSEVMLHNIDAMDIDLCSLDLICLSHGHYDHTGGLMTILNCTRPHVPVLVHPDAFCPKYKTRPGLKYIGLPFTREQAEAAGAVMLERRDPVEIVCGVMTTGEIPRIVPFETVEGFRTVRDGKCCTDLINDDQALAIDLSGKGLVVVSGCAHSGIINTVRHAQKITGIDELYAVIGGFHLMGADEKRIDATAEVLMELDPEIVRPGHCTGSRAVCILQRALGERCQPLTAGESIIL